MNMVCATAVHCTWWCLVGGQLPEACGIVKELAGESEVTSQCEAI
jgi:hypothetical protein